MAERPKSRRAPATTPQARENQLISLAYDLAEKRIREGTASAQETTHFLKMGSSREYLEQQRIENENALTQQKIESLKAAQRMEGLIEEALHAMAKYTGNNPDVMNDVIED